jgi:lipopolysaccharide/colanic/teichoic acid biosynthesis glycosyltransferase
LDLGIALLAGVVLAPVMIGIALAIVLDDGRPILFRQLRLGRGRVPFHIHKFRTLAAAEDESDAIAAEGDPRVTRVGRWLRHYRLDELPQLYDVLRGRMALVGPRPETPANLTRVDEWQLARWLAVRPGLTGATQLAFIAEDELLGHTDDPTGTYRRVVVPAKVRHGIEWLATRTLLDDLALLPRTLVVLASRRGRSPSRRRLEALLAEAGPSETPPR